MRALVMNGTGGREMLEYVERPDPLPGPGEALVEIAFAGVNFMDIGVRQGVAWTEVPNPKILGVEGVGRVLAVGDGVDDVEPGRRVAWVYAPGSYAQRIAIPAASLVPIPDTIDDRSAASVMMQGLTASHFATDFYPVQPGDVAFVHAAAGGVGLLLTQIIKLRGGHVIGRISSEEKVAAAREAGADHVIVDTEGRFAEQTLRLTRGEGVHVVYDGSGPTTFSGIARHAAPVGHVLLVWPGPRRTRTARHHEPAEEHQDWLRGVLRPYPYARTASRAFGAAIRLDRGREAQGLDRGRVSTGGRGEGSCRHGEPQDGRQAAARPVGAGPPSSSAGRAVSAGPQPRVSPANVVFSRSKVRAMLTVSFSTISVGVFRRWMQEIA